jgi:hypothetical protein
MALTLIPLKCDCSEAVAELQAIAGVVMCLLLLVYRLYLLAVRLLLTSTADSTYYLL